MPLPPAGDSSRRLRTEIGLLILVLAATTAVYLLTLRQGQYWGDDFAMYLTQAKGMAAGAFAGPNGYIYNPATPQIGPPSYPPLFPAILSLVYRFRGEDVQLMKVEVAVCFLAALFVAVRIFRKHLPLPLCLVAVGVVALNPYFIVFKDSLVSDLPFLLPCYLCLYLIDQCDRCSWERTGLAAMVLLALYAAFLTRSAAIVLIPVVAMSALVHYVRYRHIPTRAVAVLAGAGAMVVLSRALVFAGPTSYLDKVRGPTWLTLGRTVRTYFWSVRHLLWDVDGAVYLTWAGCLLLILLGAIGYWIRVTDSASALELFTAMYGLMILLWTSRPEDDDLRFLIPLIPLWVFYILVALRDLFRRPMCRRSVQVLAPLLLAVYGWSYTASLVTRDTGPIREALGDPAFADLCKYIRESTPAASVFLSPKPRLLAFATGRRASSCPQGSDTEFWRYADRIAANYMIVTPLFPECRDRAAPPGLSGPVEKQDVFSNAEFRLISIRR